MKNEKDIEDYLDGEKNVEEVNWLWKEDGLHTDWHDNGQKVYEGTYKDGEKISSKCWDENGNEMECPPQKK